jgi:drug/metabolite transporter (DMT)-like permease
MLANVATSIVIVILIRLLGPDIPVFEIVFFRNIVVLTVALPFAFRGGRNALKTRQPGLHLARGCISFVAMTCFYWAFGHLPMAESTALMFTMPLFLIALAVLFLGEKVGWRRTTATLAGFAGVIIMLRPGYAAFDPAFLIPLAVGLADAVAAVVIKKLTRTDSILTIMLYMAMITMVLTVIPTYLMWVMPTVEFLAILCVLSLLTIVSQFVYVAAWRVGDTTAIAPVNYIQIVLAGLVGFLLFGEKPSVWTAVGAVVIVGSTFYIAHREARLKRHAATMAPPGEVP